MKLNSDCVRDILLMVEDICDFHTVAEYSIDAERHKKLRKYSHEEIIYHIKQSVQAGLIDNAEYYDDGACIVINDLTPAGHDFLANIRQDNVWNGIKSIAKKVGSTSLSALIQISSNVITEIIKAQFGLGGPANPLIS